jgi:hypothetical protein
VSFDRRTAARHGGFAFLAQGERARSSGCVSHFGKASLTFFPWNRSLGSFGATIVVAFFASLEARIQAHISYGESCRTTWDKFSIRKNASRRGIRNNVLNGS